MCTDNNCINKSKAYLFNVPATVAGTTIASNVLDPDAASPKYTSLSVINDTDKDIKVGYKTETGEVGEFYVPKSIKGFTRNLKGVAYTLTDFVVYGVGADSTGNVFFNFSS